MERDLDTLYQDFLESEAPLDFDFGPYRALDGFLEAARDILIDILTMEPRYSEHVVALRRVLRLDDQSEFDKFVEEFGADGYYDDTDEEFD